MPTDPLVLWTDFRDAFTARMRATTDTELLQAWTTCGERTSLYAKTILRQVADDLTAKGVKDFKLEFEKELLRVDYALCITGTKQTQVPLVFVESENDARGARQEVGKLCALAAPVRVLITCCEWDDSPGVWEEGKSRQKEYLRTWRETCADYEGVYGSLHGVVALIVAERQPTDVFKLHYHWLGGPMFTESTEQIRPILAN